MIPPEPQSGSGLFYPRHTEYRIKQAEKLVFEKNAVIARPVRTLVVAIPRIEGKCSKKFQKECEPLRFLVVIVT